MTKNGLNYVLQQCLQLTGLNKHPSFDINVDIFFTNHSNRRRARQVQTELPDIPVELSPREQVHDIEFTCGIVTN